MEDILSEIIANKRKEVDLQKQAISIEQLSEGIGDLLPTRSMKQAIASSPTGIIAEFKRRFLSPHKSFSDKETSETRVMEFRDGYRLGNTTLRYQYRILW